MIKRLILTLAAAVLFNALLLKFATHLRQFGWDMKQDQDQDC